ncbi:histidinol-phosphate transaminase [Legionella longbeachae]|uniref:Histidinol-phosphate aminotransferase n=1 Tax=Legionella longbeachae serogroup 1 (strain NSW150) TaxID=661367 RepID=D3HS22_LEGLN|nr:histidinol-phosphate transaminase [Legionella longbeachae]VEE02202.1 histidinol-phosphate aminotransferase [Legionella oakridgensis]HBD7399369.1 histidinol-phosphate transaminase [Legionella pneumophila]ARB91495.1 histidinol-phosphate transaminase [Legionella longbeachae]ARM32080.1 histidinol-phosphate transaminase [Legionella longbeachae]EEZ95166.1 histidinol-phosphate aminotransferase 2 [Legionella longbeachae D-4968]
MAVNFQQLPHPGIRALVPYKPGKSIEELAHEKGIKDIIKLASNENPLGCSPLALAALQDMSSHVLATYPSPLNHPLMIKLANKLKIKSNQLFLSNGSDFIFNMLLTCFGLHNEKHILTHDYAFSTYAIQAHSLNIPVRSVAINPNWEINIDNFIDACTAKTSIIFLANPNNPTGVPVDQNEIKRLLESIPESTLLVVDEAYFEFAESQLSHNSIEWIEQHPNLIVTRTFSKIYGLAGARLGYAIAHPSIIEILLRVQLPFTVNQVALNTAYAALDDEEFLRLSLQTNANGMIQMRQGLEQLNIDYLPSACNFLTFNCKEDGMPLYNYLLDKGIIVRPLHPYKMDHFIRVTIGTQEQNTRFLEALNNYYK